MSKAATCNYLHIRLTYEYSMIAIVFSDVADEYYYRTAKVGQTVKFPCPSKLLFEDVLWSRLETPESGETEIYAGVFGLSGLGLDPRFTVLDKNHSHTLVISSVTLDDSQYYYHCVEDSGLGRKRFYYLTVEG